MAFTPVFTKSAKAVFNPLDGAGEARGPILAEAQIWSIETQRALVALGALASGTAVYKTTKAALDADLAFAAGTVGIVYEDGSDNGNYLKSGESGVGAWSFLYPLHQRYIKLTQAEYDALGSVDETIIYVVKG